MKLPGVLAPFFPQKTKEIKTYLALELLPTRIKVLAWDLVGDKITILSQAASEFSGESQEDKIRACDAAISQVEEKIPSGQSLSQVVFGLTEKMVVGDKISTPTLVFLKRLCQELSLTPVGFVVVNEAVANFLKKEEGTPPTVILVNYSDHNLSCALVKIGKVEMVKHQDEVTNISETLALMFKEFGVEILPSRILLYAGTANLEPIRQELISYPWLSKANFLHFPKFEILSENEDLKAIAYAGSSELLSKEVRFEQTQDEREIKTDDTEEIADNSKQLTENTEQDNEDIKKEEVKKAVVTPEEEKHEEKITEKESASLEELGFVAGQDILELRQEERSFENENFKDEETVSEPKTPRSFSMPATNINFKAIFAKISIPNISLPKISMPTFLPDNLRSFAPLLIAGFLFLLVIGILGALYWTLPKAKATLVVSSRVLEKEADITIASGSAAMDEAKQIIPGKVITVSENTSGNAPATGSKLTGDPAHGQVTIYNKTDNAKNFPKGTIIVSNSDLKFSFDSDATVASTSAFATSFSSVVVNVNAKQIGSDSNLPFGTNFTFADFPASSYIAKNDNAFSGGTSKKIQAVSKEDQDKLLKSLTGQLFLKAKAKLAGKKVTGEKIIDETVKTVITKKAFSVPVDGEASQFSLNLSVDFSALSYNENNIRTLMEKIVAGQIPADFSYQPQNSSFTLKVKEVKKDGSVAASVAFNAKLLSKINLDEVRKKLAGQTITGGRKYLLSLPNVSDVQVLFSPKLPGFLQTYPHLAKNITLKIVSQ